MKFSILQQDFLPVLQSISRSVGVRATLPILSNILLSCEGSKLKVSATNLEIGVIRLVSAEIVDPGEITVPAKTLIETVSGLNQVKIDIESEGDNLKLSANKFQAVINGAPSSEFPVIPLSDAKGTLFKKEVMLSCSSILFAAAADEGRPILTGILTESVSGNLNFVATDGFRLANRQVRLNGGAKAFKALIPRRTFEELLRILQEEEADGVEVSTVAGQNQVVFRVGLTTISSRLIEGQFPAWEKIIPEKAILRSVVDRTELLQAVKLASVFARNEANTLTLKISPDKIILDSSAKELGTQTNEVEAKSEGEDLTIAFNAKFLQDTLMACPATSVMMEFSGPLSAALIKPVGEEDLRFIVMPVRVS